MGVTAACGTLEYYVVLKDTLPMNCKICAAPSVAIGSKLGRYRNQVFNFEHCSNCGFTFISNPWSDYAQIYNKAYYCGDGPDPLIDYVFELEHPDRTVRIHEWRGILKVVQQLTTVAPQTKWIDFGCGNGGLVRHVKKVTGCQIAGFEEGWVADQARGFGIPILSSDQLTENDGTCDVVTAIEVIEHVENPVEVLTRIRRLLKPGGVLFLTTGNAEPRRGKLLDWSYVVPEIHISFFEPHTMAIAMQKAGFVPQFRGFIPGFDAILRYKILKNLKKKEAGGWESFLPWGVLARLVDHTHRVTAHPIGWISKPKS